MANSSRLVGMVLWLVVAVGYAGLLPAADEPNEEVVQMIVNLLNDKDRDMRAIGFQQVREEAKGPAATRRFADLLPTLSPDAQAGLLAALADRGDSMARPAVLTMLKSENGQVRTAAIRALGSLGETADVPVLVKAIAAVAGPQDTVAQASLTRLRGQAVNAAIVAEMKTATPQIRAVLLGVLVARRAVDSLPDILAFAEDADPRVRMAAMAGLGKLAGPEHISAMFKGVLKAEPGPEREAAEKAVMFVCNRTADVNERASPLLAALVRFDDNDTTVLLATLGRVGGADALKVVEAAIADSNPQRRDAGIHAICNWPDASVAARLLELAQTCKTSNHRRMALHALTRVAALPDKRSAAERLSLLEKAMSLSTTGDQRNYVLKRAKAIRTIESLRFVVPYLAKLEYAQEACATVVELAHHRMLREPNKAEFDKALDMVIGICKDADLVDRAKRYQKGQT